MTKLILVADDDFKNRVLVRDLLKNFGYITIEATDGRQAVELAREHKPGLILMDIHMPVLDGLQATRMLKSDEKTKYIPVIALTASATAADEEKVMQAGCKVFITKPVDIKHLLSMIAQYF